MNSAADNPTLQPADTVGSDPTPEDKRRVKFAQSLTVLSLVLGIGAYIFMFFPEHALIGLIAAGLSLVTGFISERLVNSCVAKLAMMLAVIALIFLGITYASMCPGKTDPTPGGPEFP